MFPLKGFSIKETVHICFYVPNKKDSAAFKLNHMTPFLGCRKALQVSVISHIITQWTEDIQCQTSYLPSNVAPRGKQTVSPQINPYWLSQEDFTKPGEVHTLD